MDSTPQPEIDRGDLFTVNGKLRAIWRFAIAAVAVFVVNAIAGVIAFVTFGRHPLVADAAYRVLALVMLVGAFAILLRYFDRVEDRQLAAQGLPFEGRWIRDTIFGFLLGFVLIVLSVAAIAIWGDLDISILVNPATLTRAAVVLVLLLAGAMLEEVMFRGYPFQRLVESFGPWGGILVLSVLFGAVHLKNPNAGGVLSWGFFNTIAVGVLLALAYLKTRALWFPFGFHFAWNFALGMVFGLPVSGLNIFSVLVKTKASGPKLLTGGGYGIESSLTGAVVILIGIGVVLLMPNHQSPSPEPAGAQEQSIQES